MKEQLIHILDQSVCLTRRQMKDYLSGNMLPEEMHAAEVHLSSCPLCNMAMEGFSAHTEEALAAISELNSGFLKDHFAKNAPQIHLNSMAPAATLHKHTRKGQSVPLWRVGSIAATLLLGAGLMWYLKTQHAGQIAPSLASRESAVDHIAVPAAPASDAPAPAHAAAYPAAPSKTIISGEAVRKESPVAKVLPPNAPELKTVTDTEQGQANDYGTYQSHIAAGKVTAYNTAETFTPRAQDFSAATPQSPAITAADEQSTGNLVEDSKKVARTTVAVARPLAAAPASRAEKKDEHLADARSHMEQADDFFEKKQYSSAVTHYREEMNTGSRNNRHQAAIMAARCYLGLGQKQRAIQLLQGVLAEGGPQKRMAKKMLRDLQEGD